MELTFRDICNDIGKYEKNNIKTLALLVSDHFSEVIVHKRRSNKYNKIS